MRTITSLKAWIVPDVKVFGISLLTAKTVVFLPFVILFFYSLFLAIPFTRDTAVALLEENGPIELLSFFFPMVGGVLGLMLVLQIKRHHESILVYGFYMLFSVGLLFIGLEEVAWGQWFFGFETPSYWKEVNNQNELTLHNLEIWEHHLEIFPLIFGLGGLIGVWLSCKQFLPKMTPPFILFPWFFIITAISALDLMHDFFVFQKQLDHLINYLDEVIEMMVGISGLLYIWLQKMKFTYEWQHGFEPHSHRDRLEGSVTIN